MGTILLELRWQNEEGLEDRAGDPVRVCDRSRIVYRRSAVPEHPICRSALRARGRFPVQAKAARYRRSSRRISSMTMTRTRWPTARRPVWWTRRATNGAIISRRTKSRPTRNRWRTPTSASASRSPRMQRQAGCASKRSRPAARRRKLESAWAICCWRSRARTSSRSASMGRGISCAARKVRTSICTSPAMARNTTSPSSGGASRRRS